MKKKNLSLLEDFYAEHLVTINDVKFTKREIDVIACILHGRTAKGSATLLSILPKTVQVHTQNIRNKLSVSSREGIINFIELSEKRHLAREYYSKLLVECAFEKKLEEISKLKLKGNSKPLIIYGARIKDKKSFFEKLEKNLGKAGLKTSACEYRADQTTDNEKEVSSQFHIMFAGEETKSNSSDHSLNRECLDLLTCQSYYAVVFEILKRLYPSIEIEKINRTFKEKDNEDKIFSPSPLKADQSSLEQLPFSPGERQSKKRNTLLWSATLCCFVISIFFITFSFSRKEIDQIRSDLLIPTESALLHRPEILKHIDQELKGKTGVQTVALVGPGGAGKTTIARHYGHHQKTNVIWEINAETSESLRSSFNALSQALAKTEEDQKKLKELQEVKNPDEREKKIILFVREKLKISPDWFLIYDNVEDFEDIKKYFPHNPTMWGQGRIILTTRDEAIQNNNLINSTIHIGELTPTQKLSLFTKIMQQGNDFSLDSFHNQEVKKFLNEIPSFPLDVSVAAYYLKVTNLSLESYLERLKQNRKDFEDVQHGLLKKAGDYQKTRYDILTLSLKQLIEAHPDFQDLLLLISMINSQNILRDLLDFYKEKTIVDNFIYSLKKYSLITNEPSNLLPAGLILSIHRSTQEICLNYIINTLPLDKKNQLLHSISELLENYMSSAIEKEDVVIMKFLLPHYEAFLIHKNIIDKDTKAYINIQLGGAYYFLGEEEKAKQILLDVYSKINKRDKINHLRIAQLLTYLGLTYRSLGNYSEAKECLEESLKIYETYFPENRSVKALIFTYLGNIYRNLNNYKKSNECFKKSLFLYNKYFPENLEGKALNLTYLGNLYSEIGNHKQAEIFLTQSLKLYKKQVPKNQNGLARALGYLGIVQKNYGNYEKAKDLFELSLLNYQKFLPRKSDNVAWMLAHLGNSYRELGDCEKARSFLTESQQIYEELYGKNSLKLAWINIKVGDLERKVGNYEKAKSLYHQSYLNFKKKYGEHYISIAEVFRCLGQTALALGDLKEAEEYLRKALEITQKLNHSDAYLILETLAELYLKKFQKESRIKNKQFLQDLKKHAANYLVAALEIVKINFPENSPHAVRIQNKLKKLREDHR